MTSKNIEIPVLGQLLRLKCPEEQHQSLRQAALDLEQRVSDMKERTGILQMERVLLAVALNLNYELMQAQRNSQLNEDVLKNRIQQLDHSLDSILIQKSSL